MDTLRIAPARRLELIVLLGALTAFAPLSIDMYLPALPQIARDFAVPIGSAEHTLAAFFLGISLGQAFFGPLADRFGRKVPLLCGMLLYAAACIGGALSLHIVPLVLLRFAQGVGACTGVVIARACVRDIFPATESARIFSYMMLVFGVVPLLAPLTGGYVLIWSGWRTIFWLQGAAGLLAFLAVSLRLPESHGGTHRGMDPFSIVRDYWILLVDRRFIGFVLAGALSHAGLFAYLTGSPHVFIDLFGVAPQHFGWFFGVNAAGIITVSQVTARLLRRFSPARVLIVAQSLQVTAGFALLAAAASGAGGLWGIAVCLFGFISLTAAILPTAAGLALHSFPANAGMAAALLGTIQFGAGALVATVLGAFSPSTPVPMASVILLCGLSGLVCSRLLAPRAVHA